MGLTLAFALCVAGVAVLILPAAQAAGGSAPQKLPLGWSVSCGPLPSREVDPIVYPGEVGLAHLHDPFGQRLDLLRPVENALVSSSP